MREDEEALHHAETLQFSISVGVSMDLCICLHVLQSSCLQLHGPKTDGWREWAKKVLIKLEKMTNDSKVCEARSATETRRSLVPDKDGLKKWFYSIIKMIKVCFCLYFFYRTSTLWRQSPWLLGFMWFSAGNHDNTVRWQECSERRKHDLS